MTLRILQGTNVVATCFLVIVSEHHRKMDAVARGDNSRKAEIVFMSILNRRPGLVERESDLEEQIKQYGDKGYANLIWALLNTPECFFIK